jgi:DNA-binding response OmpR family regulator
MEVRPHILVIDDDQAILDLLSTAFSEAGYDVTIASDGSEGLEFARTLAPDLIVVDLLLPRLDGYSLCRSLRQITNVPIMILSGMQDELHRIAGFELGANDFISKPFSLGELQARVRSLLRWHRPTALTPQFGSQEANDIIIEAGPLRIDTISRRAWRNDEELDLTHKEFELLAYMMQRSNVVLSRAHLMEQIWSDSINSGPRTIDVHIHSLREKIEENPASPRYIQTVRGVGYRFLLARNNSSVV